MSKDYLLKYEEYAEHIITSSEEQIARQEKMLYTATGEEVLQIMKVLKASTELMLQLVEEVRKNT